MRDLQSAVSRILVPLVRVLMARGVRFPEFSDWLKPVFLAVAERHFRMDDKRLTDSRAHMLTGLQRRDIKRLRAAEETLAVKSAGPLPRVMALWQARHANDAGAPVSLAIRGEAPSFEALVSEVSRQIHPRTVMDELIRLDLAQADGSTLKLKAEAFLPAADDTALLGYYGANLGDHAAAAAENVLAAPAPGPHFERAVHYNSLTEASVDELEALSRRLLGEALSSLNTRAAKLQRRDQGKATATSRYRAGAFIYREAGKEEDAT